MKTRTSREKELPVLDEQRRGYSLWIGIIMIMVGLTFLSVWIVFPEFFSSFLIPLIIVIIPTFIIGFLGIAMYVNSTRT